MPRTISLSRGAAAHLARAVACRPRSRLCVVYGRFVVSRGLTNRKRPHGSGAIFQVRWSSAASGARPRYVRVRMVSRFSALQKTCKNIEMAANASVFQLCVGVVRPRGNRVRLPRAVAVATACGRPRLPRPLHTVHAGGGRGDRGRWPRWNPTPLNVGQRT